ncbi:MAG: hilA 8 [Candidatus Eremiobacteraeota bacterium]|nr:hilA 8 [Candidatus Eremiobacteraeota bacterium]
MAGRRVRFGPFALDARTRLLAKDGVPVALGPMVVETLCVLVENAGELVTKDELMRRLWPNRYVDEGNLTQNVYRLRRVLSAGGLTGAIETMACRGYRFVAPVESVDAPAVAVVKRAAATPHADVPRAAATLDDDVPRAAAPPHASQRRWGFAAFAAALGFALLAAGMPKPVTAPAFARLTPESQRVYRLGRYHLNLRTDPAHVDASVRYFRDVVKRDPDNALGYSGLADAYLATFDGACDAMAAACRRVVALASENARKAVEIDPRSAEAHTSLAMTINEFTGQDSRSDAEFERAIELDPSYALAHHWYGNALLVRGDFARAVLQHKAALALEPASPATYAWLAHDAFFTRRYRDAIGFAHESLAIYPRRHPTQVLLGLAYEQVGNERAAVAAFDQLHGAERNALLAGLYARTGRRAEAVAKLRAIGAKEAFGSGCTRTIAFAWLALGDKTRAYALLRATPPANRVERQFLAFDPRFDDLRSDSRFRQWTAPN